MELFGIAVSCFVGVLGTWIKLTKARLFSLEKQEGEVKEMLKELCTGMQEIKLLLAEKGIK